MEQTTCLMLYIHCMRLLTRVLPVNQVVTGGFYVRVLQLRKGCFCYLLKKGHESQATKLWEEKGLLPLEEQV